MTVCPECGAPAGEERRRMAESIVELAEQVEALGRVLVRIGGRLGVGLPPPASRLQLVTSDR